MKSLLIILLHFLIIEPFANEYPAPKFDSPRSTMNYFLKTMKGYKQGDSKGLSLAAQSFDVSSFDPEVQEDISSRSAIYLINTLDRIERVNVQKIPRKPDQKKWVYKKETILTDSGYKDVEISIHKIESGKWLFTPKTVQTIPFYERYVKDKKVVQGVVALKTWKDKIKERMPEWTGKRSFLLLNGQWLGLFALIFLAFSIEKIIRFLVMNLFRKTLKKKKIHLSEKTEKKFTLPLALMSISIIWSLGIRTLEIETGVLSWFIRGGKVLFTVGLVLTAYQMVDILSLFLHKKASLSENKFDDILVPLVEKSLKTFVVAVGIVAIGDSLTLDMKGLIAGLGIVGLGVSLAAKDTISNLFGSLTVLLDRPFRIGDWVVIDSKVEGMVEEVGLRSCRIRTFYDSLITIPNGVLTNASIDNYGMRTYRRLSTYISVQYDTPVKKLEAYCEGIRQIIAAHPHTRKDYFHVYLNKMSSSSLDIILYVFWQVPDWAQELQERHRLLIDVIRLGQDMGIQFAFPTQTLHLFNEEKSENSDLSDEEISTYALNLARSVGQTSITPEKARSSTHTLT